MKWKWTKNEEEKKEMIGLLYSLSFLFSLTSPNQNVSTSEFLVCHAIRRNQASGRYFDFNGNVLAVSPIKKHRS